MTNNNLIKILFVASKGSKNLLVSNQANSLLKFSQGEIIIDFFEIKSGIVNYLISIFRLNKFLKRNYYHVIHAHYGWCGVVSLLAKKKEKLIVSFMGDDLIGSLNPKMKYTFFSIVVVYLNKFLAKYYYNFVIVKSNNLEKKLKGIKNVEVVPNGVNVSKFHPLNKNESRKLIDWEVEKNYVIFVSNPDRPEKNFKLAKNAINLLSYKNTILSVLFGLPNDKLISLS
mgnify:CR=1 FL=1